MPFRARALPKSITKRRISASVLPRRHTLPSRSASTAREPFFTSTHFQQPPLSINSNARSISTTTPTSQSALSALTSFFKLNKDIDTRKGKKRSTVHAGNALEEYKRCLKKGDVDGMIEAYDILLEMELRSKELSINNQQLPSLASVTGSYELEHGQASTSSSVLLRRYDALSNQDIVNGMTLLASSRNVIGFIMTKIEQMYRDTPEYFGYPLEMGHHTALALALMKVGRLSDATALLQSLPPDVVDWTGMLSLMNQINGYLSEHFWPLLVKAKDPSLEDWTLRLVGLVKRVRRKTMLRNEFEFLLSKGKSVGVEDDPACQVLLVKIWIIFGDLKKAQEIIDNWGDREGMGEALKREARLAEIELALSLEDRSKATALCLEMRDEGQDPPGSIPGRIAASLMKSGMEVKEAVETAEGETLTALESGGWEIVLSERNRALWNNPTALMDVYRFARRRGTDMTAAIGYKIVKRINALVDVQWLRIEDLMEIWEDIIRYDIDLNTPWGNEQFARISRIILLAAPEGYRPRHDIALRVLKHAVTQGIEISEVEYAIVKLIRTSINHNIAFTIYRLYAGQNTLDETTFNKLFNAFLNIRTAKSDTQYSLLPPADLIMKMIKHARQAGLTVGNRSIASVIARYTVLATMVVELPFEHRGERISDLSESLRAIHTALKLDLNVNIDLPLLNALMNAYNKLGDVEEALTVWDEIVSRRKFTPPEEAHAQYPISVCIALDVCAFNELPIRASKIWAWSLRHGFATTTKCWNDRIESLCRLGQWPEAMDMAFVKMKHRSDGAPPPNVETARLFMKFSWRVPELRPGIVDQVEKQFPEHWDEVQKHVEQVHRKGWVDLDEMPAKSKPKSAYGLKKSWQSEYEDEEDRYDGMYEAGIEVGNMGYDKSTFGSDIPARAGR